MRFFAICLVLLMPVGVWAAEPELENNASLTRVETNFRFLCAQCHGVQGDATGPNASKQFEVLPADLTDGPYMSKFTDDQIFRTLTFGGPANNLATLMPPWGNRLTEEERWELVHHIRKLCRCKGIGSAGAVPHEGNAQAGNRP
ncbi:MAG: c-type cytochrome [Leptospirillia bacterium]